MSKNWDEETGGSQEEWNWCPKCESWQCGECFPPKSNEEEEAELWRKQSTCAECAQAESGAL